MRIRTFAKAARRRTRSRTKGGIKGNALIETHGQPKAWIWQVQAPDVASATKSLQSFGRHFARPSQQAVLPRLLVLENSHTNSVEATLEYLREVLPIGAQLLEQYPQIGSGTSYGRTNAHGNPLDTHVAGICYSLPQHSIPELAALLDVYLPTRLAIGPSNLVGDGVEEPYEWETVVENADALIITGKTNCNEKTIVDAWNDVWKAQLKDQCKETYVLLDHSGTPLQPADTALAVQKQFYDFQKRELQKKK